MNTLLKSPLHAIILISSLMFLSCSKVGSNEMEDPNEKAVMKTFQKILDKARHSDTTDLDKYVDIECFGATCGFKTKPLILYVIRNDFSNSVIKLNKGDSLIYLASERRNTSGLQFKNMRKGKWVLKGIYYLQDDSPMKADNKIKKKFINSDPNKNTH